MAFRTASQSLCRTAMVARAMPASSRSLHAARPSSVLRAAAATHQAPYVKGTVNEPTEYPPPNKAHGSYHWTFERLLSAALLPMAAAPAIAGHSPVVDGVLAVSLVVHSHIGFDCILTDYLHPRKFGWIGHAAAWTLRLATVGAIIGFYQFNTNDIGLTELIRRSWSAKKIEQ